MKTISIPDDDSPPELANRLNIVQDDFGDIHIGLLFGREEYLNRGVRIRTFGGGGNNHELISKFVELMKEAERISIESKHSGIEIF